MALTQILPCGMFAPPSTKSRTLYCPTFPLTLNVCAYVNAVAAKRDGTRTLTEDATRSRIEDPTGSQIQDTMSSQIQLDPTGSQVEDPVGSRTDGPTSSRTEGPTGGRTEGPAGSRTEDPTSSQIQDTMSSRVELEYPVGSTEDPTGSRTKGLAGSRTEDTTHSRTEDPTGSQTQDPMSSQVELEYPVGGRTEGPMGSRTEGPTGPLSNQNDRRDEDGHWTFTGTFSVPATASAWRVQFRVRRIDAPIATGYGNTVGRWNSMIYSENKELSTLVLTEGISVHHTMPFPDLRRRNQSLYIQWAIIVRELGFPGPKPPSPQASKSDSVNRRQASKPANQSRG
ncbi:hypothetical protein AAF712_015531 [Marasmius tenuissimus]|uniref:Uncharacterized protein n=1 Tax=Marasmius tenuissimus TaxID=585030 RepID=A0ABR2Z820_9AGAR